MKKVPKIRSEPHPTRFLTQICLNTPAINIYKCSSIKCFPKKRVILGLAFICWLEALAVRINLFTKRNRQISLCLKLLEIISVTIQIQRLVTQLYQQQQKMKGVTRNMEIFNHLRNLCLDMHLKNPDASI